MKKWVKLFGGMATTAVAVGMSACSNSSTQAKYDKTLSWMTTSEIQTLDQNKMVDTTSGEQGVNVFEGLNRLDDQGNIRPAVAKKSIPSKDGKTWTFTLRKNAKWSNGDPVTADDFVYSLQRTLDPKTHSQQQNIYQAVKNANEVAAGKASPAKLGVEAKDKHTLVVHLKNPVPYFKTMTASNWNPVNERVAKKYGKKYGTASKYMVYNGPYIHTGWTGSNLSWKLKKNNYYWDKKNVKLNTVNYSVQKTPSTDYNLYQSKKLDGAYLDASASKQLKHQAGYRVFSADQTEYLTYSLTNNKDLANVNLRRAISMALNRKALAKTVGPANTVATTFTGPEETVGSTNFNKYFAKTNATSKYTNFNKKEAQVLFNQALKELKKPKVEFTLGGDDDDVSKKVMEYLQSQLESTFGKQMVVNVRSMPKTTRVSNMLNGKYDVDLTGLITDYTDPNSMLGSMTTGENYNFGKWSNKKFDRYINASNKEMNTQKRLEDLTKAEEVLDSQQPLTPLYHEGQAWMVRPNIHKLGFTSGSFNFRNTYVTQ
ncbi:peptide ABC transporter substrate-binding protein [Lactobacillus intestinalis]|uniref:Oligopeptide ABC transporter, substrate binding protein n=1 Tax=Lactobacillus intestinalis DSM 6629 TaxID=1423761 RepID=A0ABR5PQH8_9LACO|nr:peptide ABC transporter substrate-binding protein [Lactobacillus intestinalis]KRM32732.1 Oligopeptide ABC transporter, substrate binding protein [Lactobacillus intestinalis DSM 6629]UTW41309.1 peptide ABC transporter substrate-binding protein [Lactobacillus intestinalis]